MRWVRAEESLGICELPYACGILGRAEESLGIRGLVALAEELTGQIRWPGRASAGCAWFRARLPGFCIRWACLLVVWGAEPGGFIAGPNGAGVDD